VLEQCEKVQNYVTQNYSPLVVKYIRSVQEKKELRKHEVTYENHIAELARLREAALKERIIFFSSECGSKQRKSSRTIHR
jgi:hypothetical protein